MEQIQFEFSDNKLFLIKNVYDIFPLLAKTEKIAINSIACFSYEEIERLTTMPKYKIIEEYIRNPAMGVVVLENYSHPECEVENKKKINNSLMINMSEKINNNIVFYPEIHKEVKESIVNKISQKGFINIKNTVDFSKENEENYSMYTKLFLKFLNELVEMSSKIPKTIFLVKLSGNNTSEDTLLKTHEALRKIIKNGHIVVYSYQTNNKMCSENKEFEREIFTNDYEYYLIDKTELFDTFEVRIAYLLLPEKLKPFLKSDRRINQFSKNMDFSDHKLIIMNMNKKALKSYSVKNKTLIK